MPDDLAETYHECRALVVGATGFIGSAVAQELGKAGAEVFLLVRAPDRIEPEVQQGVAGVRAARLDDVKDLSAAVADVSPDITFNLAGYGVRPGEADEKWAFAVNVDGIQRIANAVAELPATHWRGARLVHVGSQAEYGSGVEMREDSRCHPTSVYGRSKLEGTQRLHSFSRVRGLPAVTARVFNVYGPREPPSRLLPMLYERARGRERIELTTGTQERDFTFVTDVAEGLMRLGQVSGLRGDPVNLGTGRLTPVRNFVEIAATELGISPDRLAFGAISDRPSEDRHPQISVDRLKEWTGWLPETEASDGIARTVAYLRSRAQPGGRTT